MPKQRSQFGEDFSEFFDQPGGPFANPTNDAQRVQNARAASGNTIGSGYLNPDTHKLQDPDRGFGRAVLSRPEFMIPLVVGGPLAYAALSGAPAAAAAAPEISVSSSPVAVAAPTATGAVSGAPAASSMAGFGKFFSKGLDPTSLLMMGLGFLGGDDSGQQRQSFHGTGATDPVTSLRAALEAITKAGQGLQSRGPTRLRSSYVQRPPAPVQIPGLPFQIGGGLGMDPALSDPSLLEAPGLPPELGNIFGGATAQPRQRKPTDNG